MLFATTARAIAAAFDFMDGAATYELLIVTGFLFKVTGSSN